MDDTLAREIEKLRGELNNDKRERVRAELRNKLAGVLTEKKLPLTLLDRITSETEEDAVKEIEAFATDFETYTQIKLKEHGWFGGGQVNPWKKETLNLTEQGRIMRENPEQARQLQAAAKNS